MCKLIKFAFKVFFAIVGFILSLVVVALVALNLLKFGIYQQYYNMEESICINPGLNEGLVPQGIAVSEEEDVILTCGYMKDGSNSRIYITNTKNESSYVKLTKNGEAFTGHAGGVALSGDTVYLANGKKIYSIPLSTILSGSEYVEVGQGVSVNNSASFAFADDEYLYVGEFHDGGAYVTDHEVETNDGKYYAICTQYALSDLTTPVRIYSIRNKVQGFCVTDNGTIVLSTSYGLKSSEYYVYESDKIVDSTTTYMGAPLYILDDYSYMVSGPAMSEDLSYANGKVYCLTESACNKYIFGKFFFANHIYTLDIE